MAEVGRPRPEEYQPPLGWWSHAWRLGLMVLLSVVVLVTTAERPGTVLAVDVGVGLAAYVLVFLRRRYPLGIAVATAVLGTFSTVAAGPATLAAVSLATRRNWVHVVGIGALALASATVFSRLYPLAEAEAWWVTLGSNIGAIGAMLAWGMYVGSRRELLWTLRARAERAEAERDLRSQQSRLEERSRIAREMHDVLAHRISQISMRAGALGYREDLTTDELREGVGVIRETAHQALTDLRGVLGVLRGDTGESSHAPQPTYADLDELVEEARRAGTRISYDDTVTADEPVPDDAGRTVYRIVQEGITNARKHAPDADLQVHLSGAPDTGLRVELRNPLGFAPATTPGAGLGLVGLGERAALRGGTLEHGPEGPDFVLRGWIPWTT